MKTELAKAKEFLAPYITTDLSVLCGVSGGLDSMCLLHLLTTWGKKQGIHVTAAHFHHGLRGETADRDQAFVERYCHEHHIPFVTVRGDTKALVEQRGLSVEEAARLLRYDFLQDQAKRCHTAYVLTAHHADDNAETILLQLLRGTGGRGMCGIAPQRENLLRPFLQITRAQLETYANDHAIPFVEDETNREDDFSRNRIRHHVQIGRASCRERVLSLV